MSVVVERPFMQMRRSSTLVATPNAGQEDVRFALRTVRDRLVSFRLREENWDGRGSAAPAPKAIDDALAWVEEIYTTTQAVDSEWFPPVVGTGPEGDVVFEWWRDGRKLTIFVSSDGADFLQAWGPHIEEQMFDGELSVEAIPRLWLWLLG